MREPDGHPKADDNRVLWGIILTLVVAWSAYLYFFGPKQGSGPLPPAGLRPPFGPKLAEFRWTLSDLDGKPVEFSRYKGRTIFLNIWATWCPPCVAEMPSIESLAANARLKDVAFVCVAADEVDSVRAFVESHKLKTPTLIAIDTIPEPFLTEGIPATFIIAPDGHIAVEQVGAAQWDAPKVVEFLESLTTTQGATPRE